VPCSPAARIWCTALDLHDPRCDLKRSAWHCFRVALLPLARRSRHFSAQFDVLDRVLADEGARHALCASVHITYPLEKLIYLSPISHLIALP
jgi:hypothetical protein